MRVALVTQGFTQGGGVPTVANWLLGELLSGGHTVHIYDLAVSGWDHQSRRLLAPSSWLRSPGHTAGTTNDITTHCGANWVEFETQRYRPRKPLTRELDAYDLIQVVAGGPALLLAAAKARPPKALQVATTLTSERREQLRRATPVRRLAGESRLPLLKRMEVSAIRKADVVFVENRWMETWVTQHGQRRAIYAPPGIDTVRFHPSQPWRPEGPILAFGRLGDKRKDWPTAIDAYERFVKATGSPQKMLLAGRGPLTPELTRRLSASPFRDRISVRVDVPADELPRLLVQGSVFLQTSLEEGLGLAGLEAMASGLPVVATRTAGSSEYVEDGVNGYLVPPGVGAGERLAECLKSVLKLEVGARMSRKALETVQTTYDRRSTFSVYERTYESLVAAANGHA